MVIGIAISAFYIYCGYSQYLPLCYAPRGELLLPHAISCQIVISVCSSPSWDWYALVFGNHASYYKGYCHIRDGYDIKFPLQLKTKNSDKTRTSQPSSCCSELGLGSLKSSFKFCVVSWPCLEVLEGH
jgi:hypothetical protein